MTLQIGMTPSKVDRSAGFTLIELMLVILLLSVLTGLSVPLLRRATSDFALEDTSFTIEKLIHYAQEMSVLDGVIYQLNLDPPKSVFWLTRSGVAIKNKTGRKFRLPRDLKLESRRYSVSFYPDGRADDAEIRILAKDETGRRVRVKGLLNEVEVLPLA